MTKGWTIQTLKEHFDDLRSADHAAVAAAFEAAKEKSESHNDLIRALERLQDTFVTTAQIRWMFGATISSIGLIVVIVAAFIK